MDKPYWLCHITNQYALPMIMQDKKIHPEGYSIMQNKVATAKGHVDIPADMDVSDLKKHLAIQYATIGRYVWLTEDVQCLSVYHQTPELQKCIVLDTEHIKGLKQWSEVRKTFLNNIKARQLILELEQVAVQTGDDWKQWWVTKFPINLELAGKSVLQF